MKTKVRPSAATVILESHYHTPSAAVLAAFPVVLRSGHLRAGTTYAVERRSSAGHDLLFCLNGAGGVRLRGRSFPVGKGELAWIDGYEPHAHWADANAPWELLWLRMDGPGLAGLRKLLAAEENPVFPLVDADEARRCFRAILRLMRGPLLHREECIFVFVAQLIAMLCRSRHIIRGPERRAVTPQVEIVMNRMALYPNRAWSAAELAKLAGMSVPRLYRGFRQMTGSSPIDWLRRERINFAKRRLIESDDSVKAVADQAGYNSPYFFSRDFKRSTGRSPTEFRRRERNDP